jgi:hypothetical protein
MQYIFFNSAPNNLALEEISPKIGSFAFYQKKALSVKQPDLRNMLEKASKCVCVCARARTLMYMTNCSSPDDP